MGNKVAVIGTGYIGLTTGVCLAEMGHTVTCVDIDEAKIQILKTGSPTIYEPGLGDLMKKNNSKLHYTLSYTEALENADIVFLAVNTPSLPNGEVNLKYLFQAAEAIGKNLKKDVYVVNKSTVPVGTGLKIEKLIRKNTHYNAEVISCPEFLREGNAVHDFFHPYRIVIGTDNKDSLAVKILQELFKPLPIHESKFLITDLRSAEMIKYASNSFLAMQISFINELGELCEKTGVDVCEVARGMKLDDRIGKEAFLKSGLGFGGSCFPKDVRALIALGKKRSSRLHLLEQAKYINDVRIQKAFSKLKNLLRNAKLNLKTSRIIILGATFKPETDDIRESQSIKFANYLLESGCKNIVIIDPHAKSSELQKQFVSKKLEIHTTKDQAKICDACTNADIIVLGTEWDIFTGLDFKPISSVMRNKLMLDLRNSLSVKTLTALGFTVANFGKKD